MLTAEKCLPKQLKKVLILLAILVFSFSVFALANNVFAVDTPLLSNENGAEDVILSESLSDTDELPAEDDKINEDIVPAEENDKEIAETSAELPIEEADESAKDDIISELPETVSGDNENKYPENETVIDLIDENNEIVVEKSMLPKAKEVPVPQVAVLSIQNVPELKQAKVTIKCIEKGTNKVLKTKEIEGTVGATLTIYAEKINGYKSEKEKVNILVVDGSNSVTFLYNAVKEQEAAKPEQKKETLKENATEYIKKGIESIVKINYVDTKGNTISKSKEVKSISGNVLTAYAEKIDGYAATKQKETVTVKESGSTITFIYKKNNTEEKESEMCITESGTEKAESADIPQTGDDATMIICAVIALALSLGCAIVLKKKNEYLIKN